MERENEYWTERSHIHNDYGLFNVILVLIGNERCQHHERKSIIHAESDAHHSLRNNSIWVRWQHYTPTEKRMYVYIS